MHTLTDNTAVASTPEANPQLSLGSATPEILPIARLADAERRAELSESIKRLNPRQQELVYLKFEGGLSYQQMANVTQLSTSNVGYILHTAIRALRASLSTAQPSLARVSSSHAHAPSVAATNQDKNLNSKVVPSTRIAPTGRSA